MHKGMSYLWFDTSPESPASIEQSVHKWWCECLMVKMEAPQGLYWKPVCFLFLPSVPAPQGLQELSLQACLLPYVLFLHLGRPSKDLWDILPMWGISPPLRCCHGAGASWKHSQRVSWCPGKDWSPPCCLGAGLPTGLKGVKTYFWSLLSADLALMHACKRAAFSHLCCLL